MFIMCFVTLGFLWSLNMLKNKSITLKADYCDKYFFCAVAKLYCTQLIYSKHTDIKRFNTISTSNHNTTNF